MVALSPCLGEPAFSAAALFGICATANFRFGSRQGIRIGRTDSLVSIFYFNPWKPTSSFRPSRSSVMFSSSKDNWWRACARLRRIFHSISGGQLSCNILSDWEGEAPAARNLVRRFLRSRHSNGTHGRGLRYPLDFAGADLEMQSPALLTFLRKCGVAARTRTRSPSDRSKEDVRPSIMFSCLKF
jgi:hypothetical protein